MRPVATCVGFGTSRQELQCIARLAAAFVGFAVLCENMQRQLRLAACVELPLQERRGVSEHHQARVNIVRQVDGEHKRTLSSWDRPVGRKESLTEEE